jgi:ferrous iron transport protein B
MPDRLGKKPSEAVRLDQLQIGQRGRILTVGGDNVALRQHMLDMGLIPGTVVEVTRFAPLGDPMQIKLHSFALTLRLEDASKLEVRLLEGDVSEEEGNEKLRKKTPLKFEEDHPGLGEGGKYHVKADENPLPEGTLLTFALAGNQNAGKTTLFNQITGSNQHVGNFPGVTVDRKSASIRGYDNTEVTDLPGIYSLSPYSGEEVISREFILEEKPKCLINIVDATNLERNLYLTMQLMELEVPMVLALNMMDEVQKNGGTVDINRMEDALGIPVVPISAVKNEGVDELLSHAVHVAHYQEKPGRQDFCKADEAGGAVHRALHALMYVIEDHAQKAGIPCRFAATKLAENDSLVKEALKLDPKEEETIELILQQMEEERGLDRVAAIADMRYRFIGDLVALTVTEPQAHAADDKTKTYGLSHRVDRILTGKYTALPIFILAMAVVFWLTFDVIGGRLQKLSEIGLDKLAQWVGQGMAQAQVSPVLQSLVMDGLFKGVGSVVSFLPIIVTLFFFLSLLEDTGYMARVAFVIDKVFRKFGLSGRSVVPLLIGFGCTVPAVMATRTLPSERDRKMTILLTPFMSCSAKLPIYAFFSQAFFPDHAALVMTGLYVLGILLAMVVALILKKTSFQGESVPFVMELPNYRVPGFKNTLRLLWDKAKDFLERAFTIILIGSLVIWFLQSFNSRLQLTTSPEESLLASLAGFIAPIFKPMGYGNWRIVTSLLAGFMAKESVVSSLNILYGSMANLMADISALSAFSLLVFCLLYTPCIAAVSTIKREIGGKETLGLVLFQCAFAWLCSFITYGIGALILMRF